MQKTPEMSKQNTIPCLILGAGPAGYTAAIYAARAGLNPVLYTGDQPGGQLMITSDVENFPGYPEGITGPEMMEDLQKQAARFGTDIRMGLATAVNLSQRPFRIEIDQKSEILCESLIICTGASAKWLYIPGEQAFNGKGVSACAVCDGFFFRGQNVAVVGGGDTACEEASYLAKLCSKVYLLVRRDEMRASKIMQERVKKTPNIEILWNTSPAEILGDNAVTGVRIKNNLSGEESTLDVTGFFVAIGHEPNTSIFKGQLEMDEAGYLITQPGTTKTSVEGVFAAGDVQDRIYRQAITAAGTGCMAALETERFLAEKELAG